MRLRGEYLYNQKRYSEIGFSYLKDGKKRMFSQQTDKSYKGFMKYMTTTFMYANTRSLKNDMTPKNIWSLNIGDVFIQSGNPYGHAVIVVDKIQHTTTKEIQYLLAQSYMPAQEIQILINPKKSNSNPWYTLSNTKEIVTPEWTFYSDDLRTF
jgi:diaminopimelate epimerase